MPKETNYTVNAGWLVDGSGEPARRRVAVEVRAGRISRIRPFKKGDAAAEGALDFSGDTVLPCLVDSHVHLFMSGTTDPVVREAQLDAGFDEARKGIEKRLERHAAHGVMTVRDGGDRQGHTLRYCREYLPQRFASFTVRAAGRAWHSAGRYGKMIGRSPDPGRRLADAVAADADGPDYVKIVNSGLNSLLSFGRTTASQFSPEAMAAAVRAAAAAGRRVMVHANGPEPVRCAVEAGCHSVEHGFFMGPENLARMADSGTVWVPTAVTMKAYSETLAAASREAEGAARNLDHQLGQIALARRLGVNVAVGSDAGSLAVDHGSGCIEEIRLLIEAGYRTEEAVFCASVQGLQLTGADRVGRLLAPGRAASFIVCPGGPDRLADSLYRIRAVFVEGTRVENRK